MTNGHEKITLAQIQCFETAYDGYDDIDELRKVFYKLTKKEAIEVINNFHGASYWCTRSNPNEHVAASAKKKLENGVRALERHGYVNKLSQNTCRLCRVDRSQCCC